MRRRLALALVLAAGLGAAALAAEVQDTLRDAYQAFAEGRLDDAAAGYKYLATMGMSLPDPDVNLAIVERDKGRAEEALPLWIKASLRESADGFIWNQRGWAYAALDRPKEAREAFLKGVDRSSTTAMQAEASLGLGVAASLAGQPKGAIAALRQALVLGPYAMPMAAYQTGLASLGARDKNSALAYLRQCGSLDPWALECLQELAAQLDKAGDNRGAWRTYRRILDLDGGDPEAARRLKKTESYLGARPEDLAPVRRLPRPMLSAASDDLPVPRSSATVRVALFSGPDGKPATATRVYFMTNAEFKLVAGPETVRDNAPGGSQWEVVFREETNAVEVRDASRNIQLVSKQPFRIVPKTPVARGSVLLKSAAFVDPTGIDAGDRELRGVIEVVPTPYGFKLVNDVNLEEYVYGAVSSALPDGSPMEAYRAQAVVARTLALWSRDSRPETLERTDLCDSSACLRYVGLSEELRAPVKAAAETEGWVLTRAGRPARLYQHAHCGGVTEDGRESGLPGAEALASVHDAERPSIPPRTPEQLERLLHENPPRDRFCEAGGVMAPSHSRWMRYLSADDVRGRLERLGKTVGAVRHLRAARRSVTGRVKALEIVGSRGSVTVEGDDIARALSPGSLRSTLFTVQRLPKGFLLWGAGSGHGVGYCVAGSIGQASLGRSWRAIVEHYFPTLALTDLYAPQKPSDDLKPGKLRRTRNPKRTPRKP